MNSIKKILVANRGEIALRIMKTAKEMTIGTVAIYSDVDVGMPFVRYADEAYNIGKAPATESYLNGGKIIETAVRANVDAIHPGYGFLSETKTSPKFAKRMDSPLSDPKDNPLPAWATRLKLKR